MRTGLAACALAAVVLAGCGGDATKQRREAVNDYFDSVQKAQVDLIGHQSQISAALASFSLRAPSAKDRAALQSARNRVDKTLRRVQALDAPEDAAVLDGLIVRRLALQRDLLDELLQTWRDASVLTGAVPKLGAASRALRADLAAISGDTVPAGGSAALLGRYGDAFGRYGDALRPVVRQVEPSSPSLLRPSLVAQHAALQRSVRLCDEIRADLGKQDVDGANEAVHSLLTIAATLNGAATRKAEAAAAKVYNARIARLSSLERKIVLERGRLVREIG